MTTRRARDNQDRASEKEPDLKRPKLLAGTAHMTQSSDPEPDVNGRSPVLKAVRGGSGGGPLLGRHGLIDRVEYVRLLEQALSDLGFAEVAAHLERASGIASQPSEINQLQRAVLAGDWAGAVRCVGLLELRTAGAAQEAKFIILEQAYLEALQHGDSASALACLRDQLTPLAIHPHRLHQLAARLMCHAGPPSGAAQQGKGGQQHAAADGGGEAAQVDDVEAPGSSRQRVLRQLQAVIPPEVMLPERRLPELVEQALAAQIQAARFHNSPGARPSLLRDYTCGTEQIPTCTTQVLLDHQDEVWHLQFSHDGRMLASCGKDQTAIIWEVQRTSQSDNSTSGTAGGGSSSEGRAGQAAGSAEGRPGSSGSSRRGSGGSIGMLTKRHVLRGHTGPIAFLCWSPDDAKLVTCGQDSMRLWDVASGKCLATFLHHKEPVTCAAWFPDGTRLVTGSHDKQLCVVRLDGTVERVWRIQRIQEVLVAKGGRYILATTCERKVRVYDLQEDTESFIPEAEPLISMSLSRDGRHLLVNLTSNAMHLWDCGDDPGELRVPNMPCATYQGASDKQSRFVVRSCLGGLDDRFVLTGSEECKVYVYHRHSGERLLALEGHSGTVNSVAWSPTDPHMFASASDDKSIHIWQVPPQRAPGSSGASSDAPMLDGAATQ